MEQDAQKPHRAEQEHVRSLCPVLQELWADRDSGLIMGCGNREDLWDLDIWNL